MKSPTTAPALIVVLLISTLAACSDDPPKTGSQDTTAAASETTDDVNVGDSTLTESDVQLDCPGGAGCPCAANSDCDSAICSENSAGSVCARLCVDSCPGGFVCKPYTGGGGDGVNICVPRHGRRCDPCESNESC